MRRPDARVPAAGGGTLADRQIAMASALSSAASEWPPALLEGIVAGGTLDAAGALGVYRSGYLARLTEQLGETYATVWRVVGDETFFALAESYIGGQPSTSYNLSDYGRTFADFLDSLAEAPAPFLAELARFELAFHDLFHAQPHVPVDSAALASLGDLTGVRFRFGTALRLVACEFAVFDLFRHRNDEVVPDLDVDRPQWLLMFKPDVDVRTLELERATFVVLEALAAGAPVDEALARATTEDDRFGAAEVTRLFELIARCGLVVGWDR